MSRAAYMREYRARKRIERGVATTIDELAEVSNREMARQASRIAELEEEVRRLKRELAARGVGPSFGYSRPAPKPGRHG